MARVKIYERPGALALWWRAWGWMLVVLLVLGASGVLGLRVFGHFFF